MALDKETLDSLRIDHKPEPERRTWPWIPVLIVLALGAGVLWWWLRAAPAVEVTTVSAREPRSGLPPAYRAATLPIATALREL